MTSHPKSTVCCTDGWGVTPTLHCCKPLLSETRREFYACLLTVLSPR